jgi:hypothetical protein
MPKRVYEEGEIDDEVVNMACKLIEESTLNENERSELIKTIEVETSEPSELIKTSELKTSELKTSELKTKECEDLDEGWGEGGDWEGCEGETWTVDQPGLRVEKRHMDQQAERVNVLILWNKLRWTSPSTWKQVTTRNETPHSLLLKYHISTHYKMSPCNSVQENIQLVLRLLEQQ